MVETIAIEELNGVDLNMYQCGTEKCKPGHYFGPAVRDYFLIHYISYGKGIFQIGDTTYNLSKGQGFLIYPNVLTYYQADSENPWHYTWVGFHGLKAKEYLEKANLTMDSPTFTYRKDNFIENCFRDMINCKEFIGSKEMRLLGLLYLFLSQLIEHNSKSSLIVKKEDRNRRYMEEVVKFIEINYSRKISVTEIAEYIGLDRSYMGALFKKHFNISPQDYLINFRINRACSLMKNLDLTIGEISRSVGYDDPFAFSKMFKKVKGLPPRTYRKNNITG